MASAVSCRRDRSTTSWPALAATSAMPDPMIPEPTMPTRLIVMAEMLPIGSLTEIHAVGPVPVGRRLGTRLQPVEAPVAPRWRACHRRSWPRSRPAVAALLDRARPPVLDLDEPEARAAAARRRVHRSAVRFASIVCTGALVDQPDLGRATRALAGLLADDGELLDGRAGQPGRRVGPAASRARALCCPRSPDSTWLATWWRPCGRPGSRWPTSTGSTSRPASGRCGGSCELRAVRIAGAAVAPDEPEAPA